MSKLFIDANVFIYLNDVKATQRGSATKLIQQISTKQYTGFVSPYVLNEVHYYYLRKLGHHEAQQMIHSVLALPNLKLRDIQFTQKKLRHAIHIAKTFNLRTFDAFHAYYCKSLKIKQIATWDTDFKRVPWLTVLQPEK